MFMYISRRGGTLSKAWNGLLLYKAWGGRRILIFHLLCSCTFQEGGTPPSVVRCIAGLLCVQDSGGAYPTVQGMGQQTNTHSLSIVFKKGAPHVRGIWCNIGKRKGNLLLLASTYRILHVFPYYITLPSIFAVYSCHDDPLSSHTST